jgi:hypothetical protein
MTREDVVQAALTVERWCKAHGTDCRDCPFFDKYKAPCAIDGGLPESWGLEDFLKNRGMKHD